jgi:iron-sulfur cluster assembly protein
MADTLDIACDITITEKAVKEIQTIMADNSIPETYGLRIGVKGGGCSGLTYSLGFDAEIRDTDLVLDISGVKLVVDAKSAFYLTGTELDYSSGLQGRGFVFNNPNAVKTCGCGSSFSA